MKCFSWLLKIFCAVCTVSFFCGQAHAQERCYSKMSEVLQCFFKHNDGAYKYEFVEENKDNPNITIRTYILYSQKWPVGNYKDIPTTDWKHKLVLYIPEKISYTKVLLYVNGGRNRNDKGDERGYKEWLSPKELLDYAAIAVANKAVVVELQDVPNQYLPFNSEYLKEDQILAYTYKKVIDDPLQNAYLAGHLPMAKAILKAMDAIQDILKQKYDIKVTGFILSGASKRGWAVWLAALYDDRVEAIIPIVVDILNTQKSIKHIFDTYGKSYPPALRDYKKYDVLNDLDSSDFIQLMRIEDPFSYLQEDYDSKYKQRLAIPKYIINASGDDFFVPDASKLYFKSLPGNDNYIRYLPNAMHYFRGNPVSDSTDSLSAINKAISSYFYLILNKVSLPKVDWVFSKDKINITSSMKPSLVKLWVANNEVARDFRFLVSYSKWHLLKKKLLSYFSTRLCDNCYDEEIISFGCKENTSCNVQVSLPSFKKGWQASFVELHYGVDNNDFIITTEVNIVPDNTFPEEKNFQTEL